MVWPTHSGSLATQLLVAQTLVTLCLLFGAVESAAQGEGVAEDEETLRVELNTATIEELCLLPGIGPKKANAIIKLRERRPFTRVTQLLRVRGIGRKTLRRLKPFVFVAPERPRAELPGQASGPSGSPLAVGAPRGTPS
jgi:competence protein ComEA